jgi:hypothetical protein
MRSYEEYKKILELWERGYKQLWIAQDTGIPRAKVRDCISKYRTVEGLNALYVPKMSPSLNSNGWEPEIKQTYAYLLGVYLGDGYISKVRYTHRFRIFMDSRYVDIISKCVRSINVLLPDNKVSVNKHPKWNLVEIGCYSNHWVSFFPQHGAGRKHKRDIKLLDWQQAIIEAYPIEFIRGLIHTDGCRINPVVNGKVYSRYQFTNRSQDILDLFCRSLKQLGINWTFYAPNIMISRRKDVAYLDTVIGAKS